MKGQFEPQIGDTVMTGSDKMALVRIDGDPNGRTETHCIPSGTKAIVTNVNVRESELKDKPDWVSITLFIRYNRTNSFNRFSNSWNVKSCRAVLTEKVIRPFTEHSKLFRPYEIYRTF